MGRPTVTLMLTHTMLETGSEALLALMQELKKGFCNDVHVKLGRLQQLMLTAKTERIDFLHDFEFSHSSVKDATSKRYYLACNPEKTGSLGHTQEFQLECETNLWFLLDHLRNSENLYEQIELLQTLQRLRGVQFDTGFGEPGQQVTVADLSLIHI